MDKMKIDDIEIEVQKKKIKNLYLTVTSPKGMVRVSAPKNMSEDAIRMFILTKISWIKKHQEKYKNAPAQIKCEYKTGDFIALWGKNYPLVVQYSHKNKHAYIHEDKVFLQIHEGSSMEQRSKIIQEWYRAYIKKEIPPLVEKWQDIIGVWISDWGVKNMKTRWGTCNIKAKRIWLNLQLAKMSPSCLEYVVVHELVHLLEKKHNKVFKAYMDKFLPDWKTIKASMKLQFF